MKRSLNNRFKGKRLVEGDENEINAHELLLKEEDNKIVVKGRGKSGNVEVLSGGNSKGSLINNVWYYTIGSISGVSNDAIVCTKAESASLLDFFTTGFNKVKPENMTTPGNFVKKIFAGEVIGEIVSTTDYDKEITSSTISVDSNCKGLYAENSMAQDGTITSMAQEDGKQQIFISVGDSTLFDIYDSTSNTLLYYATGSNSKPTYMTITPESLVKDMNIIVFLHNKGTCTPYLNGKALHENNTWDSRVKRVFYTDGDKTYKPYTPTRED